MAKHILCSQCHEKRWMQNRVFKRNLTHFKIASQTEFDTKYICIKCRRLNKKTRNIPLSSTVEFKETQKALQEEINIHIERGLGNADARQNFSKNVKLILDKQHLSTYSFKTVNNNELIGIMISNVPFYGDVLIELNGKGKK